MSSFIKPKELTKLRTSLSLSLRDCEKYSDGQIITTTLHSYERGVRTVSLDNAIKIVTFFSDIANSRYKEEAIKDFDMRSFVKVCNKITSRIVKYVDASLERTRAFSTVTALAKVTERRKKRSTSEKSITT